MEPDDEATTQLNNNLTQDAAVNLENSTSETTNSLESEEKNSPKLAETDDVNLQKDEKKTENEDAGPSTVVDTNSQLEENANSENRQEETAVESAGVEEEHPLLKDVSETDADIQNFPKRSRRKRKNDKMHEQGEPRIIRSAFGRNYVDYIFFNDLDINIYRDFLNSIRTQVTEIVKKELIEKMGIKTNMFLVCSFTSPTNVILEYAYKTPNSPLNNDVDIDEHIENQFSRLLTEFEIRELSGSGFTLSKIKYLEYRISKLIYLPGRGKLKIPDWIVKKKAVINISSNNDECFKLAILCKHDKRVARRTKFFDLDQSKHKYNFNIKFPPSVSDIRKFIKLNKNVSINIFGIMKENIYPIDICKNEKSDHFNLLYVENGKKAHFCYIKNLSRLIRSQVTKDRRHYFFCCRCFLKFRNKCDLDVHKASCGNEQLGTIVFPKNKEYYEFKNFFALQKCPLLLTFDMECLLQDVSTCNPNHESSFTNVIQSHKPVSFGIHCYSDYDLSDIPYFPIGYHGRICKSSDEFENELIEYFLNLTNFFKIFLMRNYKLHLTPEVKKQFEDAKSCFICNKPFTDLSNKIFEHDHLKKFNNFRGAAHQNPCNNLLRKWGYIPCYVHALSAYDGHEILKVFAKKKYTIKVMPSTLEKFMSISVWINGTEIRFLDSYRLLNASLDAVTSSMPSEHYKETKKVFKKEVHELVLKKGPFPYKFLSKTSRLDYKKLPCKKWFNNDLSGEEISDIEYQRAVNIWNRLECSSFKDFVSIYQCSDTTQLMDILLFMRDLFYNKFGLEICAFISLPHLSMECMLRLTGVRIEVISQEIDAADEMYEMIKRSIYGGMTMCNLRYFEPSENEHVQYIDINSLYPFCMYNFKLPLGDYKFVANDLQDWDHFDLNSDMGYILQADFMIPSSLHSYLECLPPISERKKPPGCNSDRLINDFSPKYNYVLSLAMYQLLIKLGIKCLKISKVIQFRQSFYMKSYIEILSKWRQQAKSSFESNFYKMALNSLYGKYVEAVEKRRNIQIITDEKKLEKLVRKGNFIDRHILSFPGFKMILVELAKGVVKQNRPNIVGSQILSWSKYYMLSMFYDVLKPAFQEKELKLIFMDTDSFIYKVKSDTFFEDLKKIRQHFDFSNMPVNHPLYSKENEKVLGKFKDESCGARILAICAPRTKTYSILYEDKEINKLKGIQKAFVKNHIRFQDYKNCVLNHSKYYANFKSIISKDHNLYTVSVNKLALEATDRKRVILQDGINTLPYFHEKLTYL